MIPIATWFLLASLSAVLSAAAAILQKKILFQLTALEFSFVVSCTILTISFAVPFSMDVTALSTKTMLVLLVKSLLGGSAFLLVMMSLEKNPITSALPLLGLTPAITAVFGLLILSERLSEVEWIGIAVMVAGTFILEQKPTRGWTEFFRAANRLPIVGALLLFALSSVLDRMLVTGGRVDPRIVLFYQHIVYALLFAVMLGMRKRSFSTMLRRASPHIVLILMIALVTVGYRWAQLEATKLAPVALVLAVKRTSILYASVVGGKLFSEEGLTKKLIAAALIVGAGFLMLRHLAG